MSLPNTCCCQVQPDLKCFFHGKLAEKLASSKSVAPPEIRSDDGLAAAVRYEIAVAEKQIKLLLLRIEQNPAIAANVRPFGSNLHRLVTRLKKALAAANDGSEPPLAARKGNE